MKIVAVKNRKCYCCSSTINKGEECFVLFVNPSDPESNEFDAIYTCLKCIEQEACKTRIRRRGATPE